MHNLYEQFRQLIPDPPLQAGTVVGVGAGVVTVAIAPSSSASDECIRQRNTLGPFGYAQCCAVCYVRRAGSWGDST